MGAITAIVSWLIMLLLIRIVIKLAGRGFVGFEDQSQIIYVSYFALTLLGLIICNDNVNNFGVPFSRGHDDSEFFYIITEIISGRPVEIESAIFVYPLAMYGWILELLMPFHSLELYDLLPLIWAAGSIVVGLSNYLGYTVYGKEMPRKLAFTVLVGNYIFISTTTVLYRDIYIVLFSLIALILYYRRQVGKSFIAIIITTIYRGANGLLLFFFLILSSLSNKIKYRLLFRIIVLLIFLIFIFSIESINNRGALVKALSSTTDNFSGYYSTFSGMKYSEIVESRYERKFNQTRGRMATEAYKAGGPIGFSIRIIHSLFYPITYYSPYMDEEFSSVYGNVSYVRKGFFVFNIVKWVTVSCWMFIIPFLLIGWFRSLTHSEKTKGFLILYFISLIGVTITSGNPRHTLSFIIFNPLFVNIGYNSMKSRHRLKNYYMVLVIFVSTSIIAYNAFK